MTILGPDFRRLSGGLRLLRILLWALSARSGLSESDFTGADAFGCSVFMVCADARLAPAMTAVAATVTNVRVRSYSSGSVLVVVWVLPGNKRG